MGCLEYGSAEYKKCVQKADQGYEECTQKEDHGYEKCTQEVDQGYKDCAQKKDQGYSKCCDWWPCSWACDAMVWVSNIVCVAWTWVSNIVCVAKTWVENIVCVAKTWIENIVCVAWTVVKTSFCVLWDAVTTVVNAIGVTLESTLGWLLNFAGMLVEIIQMIPFVGTLVRWVMNGVTNVVSIIASIPDFIMGLAGVRPEKKMRICTVVLKDQDGNAVCSTENAIALLQNAVDVYRRDANVRLVPLKGFQYASGFGDAEKVDASWIKIDNTNSDDEMLDQPCGSEAAGKEWVTVGSKFQQKSTYHCMAGSWRRVTGYGAPVTCFIVRDVIDKSGCALWITDYVVVEGETQNPHPRPRVIGHECGHACSLTHRCVDEDVRNLMGVEGECDPDSTTQPDVFNPRMTDWQALVVRTSKHVTYF